MILAKEFYLQLNYGNLCAKFVPFVAFPLANSTEGLKNSETSICLTGLRLANATDGRRLSQCATCVPLTSVFLLRLRMQAAILNKTDTKNK